ncbi:hypothetical protein E2C01_078716 [Portunus trituberculatus]|uniref:Uncharacterized protein n=1 Tax=Portunus trituberculatus TaxID=210409 RepID=A0A5B7IJJ2_PORTR|nr:hypothetical protein [Portunus trituberculatus]
MHLLTYYFLKTMTVFIEIDATREENKEAPQAQPRRAGYKARATTASWVPADANDISKIYNYLGPELSFDDYLRQPIEYEYCLYYFTKPWYSGTMRALGSEGSPSVRVRILSTVRL